MLRFCVWFWVCFTALCNKPTMNPATSSTWIHPFVPRNYGSKFDPMLQFPFLQIESAQIPTYTSADHQKIPSFLKVSSYWLFTLLHNHHYHEFANQNLFFAISWFYLSVIKAIYMGNYSLRYQIWIKLLKLQIMEGQWRRKHMMDCC